MLGFNHRLNREVNPGLLACRLKRAQYQPMVASAFAARITQRLAQLGKSQTWLAERCDVSPQAVTKWLVSGKISRSNLVKAADALGVSAHWLATGALVTTTGDMVNLDAAAIDLARDWQRLGADNRRIVRNMISDMLDTPGGDCDPVADSAVVRAFGSVPPQIHEPEAVYIPAPPRRRR